MKKLTTLFIVAVLGPSLVLAWLAVRSLADQEMVMRDQVERRAQGMTTTVAQDVNVFMDDVRLFYRQQVDDLVRQNDNRLDATWLQGFDQSIRSRWGQVKVGCVITEGGKLYSPESKSQDLRVENFLKANNNFFNNRAVWEVYRAPARQSNDLLAVQAESSHKQVSSSSSWKFIASAASSPVAIPSMEKKEASAVSPSSQVPSLTKAKLQKAGKKAPAAKIQNDVSSMQVRVTPQNSKLNVAPQVSKLRSQAPALNQSGVTLQQQQKAMAVNKEIAKDSIALTSATQVELVQQDKKLDAGKRNDLLSVEGLAKKTALNQLKISGQFANLETDSGVMQEVIGKEREGALGRFLEDGLHLYLWYRPQVLDSKIFWVELDLKEIRQGVQGIIKGATFADSEGFCLALLDDEGGLIGKNRESYEGDWSKSLVSTEVGSILPRWQVAAYLINPKELMLSARNLRLTMLLLVAVLIIAIGIGGWLIIKVTSREMHLARQKTDFVSNVSHELRTPLTSIRMFSELLGRVGEVDDAKRVEYAGIIDSETGRLTRLINQLLDFSKMERGGKRFKFESLSVESLVSETVENYRHSLEADGGTLIFHQGTGTENLQVKGDKDALSQIILNLLSNAEKYGGTSPEVEVEVEEVSAEASIEIRVKDRGAGIDRREVAKIFEKFYRVDDSLASGIEGSGLGLSLARQLARAHDGELSYRRRPGGGSCFVLSLLVLESVEQC